PIRRVFLAFAAESEKPCSPPRPGRLKNLQDSIGGTAILLHDLERVSPQIRRLPRVRQEPCDRGRQFGGLVKPNSRPGSEKKPCHLTEVFHVRSEHDWFTVSGWFQYVMAARGDQRAAHENDIGVLKCCSEFADAIKQQDIRQLSFVQQQGAAYKCKVPLFQD